MHAFLDYIINFSQQIGYRGIFLMMIIESSVVPFPSELAMIPAGYLSSIGKMNIFIAFFAGSVGALVGASINYFGAKYLGRPTVEMLIKKYGKYLLLSDKKYHSSEKFFVEHGAVSTFIGRLIPAVRQLISIPAGLFSMQYSKFLFFTFLGAGSWNIILLAIGYIAGENSELIKKYSHYALGGAFIFIVITIGIYIIFKKHVKNTYKK